MKHKIVIDPDICQACGACVADCPKHLFTISKKLNKAGRPYAVWKDENCTGCGICFKACPSPGAISLDPEKNQRTEIKKAENTEFSEFPKVLQDLFKKTLSGKKDLKTGNEAAVYGALLGGSMFFFAYPITPATEIAELSAELYLPLRHHLMKLKKEGKYHGPVYDFLQGESEVAVINMLYGAASTGARVMTATSSPGYSLMTEGISYAAQAELPFVIVDIIRGGPGLGNIAPSQADLNQLKASGHGPFKLPILAPNSAQEMCDFTKDAFRIAHEYRTPVIVAADGDIGHGKENIIYPEPVAKLRTTPWAVHGTKETRLNVISSIHLAAEEMEIANQELLEKYNIIQEKEVKSEKLNLDTARIVLIGYGSVSRTMMDVINELGSEVGMFRPKTLWPLDCKAIQKIADDPKVETILVSEQNDGQLLKDIELIVKDKKPIRFYGRLGGMRVSKEELLEETRRLLK